MIIGESASRDFMSAYTGVVENTPWMDSLREADGWIKYENAYSCHTHTLQTLTAALTDGRVITGTTYPESLNLITLSNLAGFKTTWLSNQGAAGPWDTPISALARLSDTVRFTGPDTTGEFDEKIFSLMEEKLPTLDLSANNLLVIHLAGSHFPFEAHPEKFAIRHGSRRELGAALDRDPEAYEYFNRYAANLQFTDHILQGIFNRLSAYTERPAAIIYFADHGTDVFSSSHDHDYKTFTWSKARIPMLIWLSEQYRDKYPEKSGYLRSAREKIFTNDLIFDLYSGIADIKFKEYKPEYDLGSPEYMLNQENAVIGKGTWVSFNGKEEKWTASGQAEGKRIDSDPYLRAAANAELETGFIVAAHRANTLFKARQASRFGIRNMEIDLVYAKNGQSDDLMVGHDSPTFTGAVFAEYLAEMQEKLAFLWVDVKNLNAGNRQAIYAQFAALDARYGLKNRLLIESSNPDALSVFAENGWTTTYDLPWGDIVKTAKRSAAEAENLAREIAGQLRKSGVTGVSYDFAADAEVREYLLPELPPETKCYARQMGWNYADGALPEKLKGLKHLSVLLITFSSPFKF